LSEVFNNIKMLKLYGWPGIFKSKLLETREKELKILNTI
jgi:ABC-type bacteriocin/lantibiotic exporter with double-glycine peptidase domain